MEWTVSAGRKRRYLEALWRQPMGGNRGGWFEPLISRQPKYCHSPTSCSSFWVALLTWMHMGKPLDSIRDAAKRKEWGGGGGWGDACISGIDEHETPLDSKSRGTVSTTRLHKRRLAWLS
jgi:hypothetical protein